MKREQIEGGPATRTACIIEAIGEPTSQKNGGKPAKPVAFVLYHYFAPDEVVSAHLNAELCFGLARRGWSVTAFPCVWGSRDDSVRYASWECLHNVTVRRIWRPRFRQSSGAGRVLNAMWMIASWSLLALQRDSKPDVLLVGTDPILSILVARFWKVVRPKTKIVHWCLDLYPEAAIAEGILPANGILVRMISRAVRPAYKACSLIADLGSCMRDLLTKYPSAARRETLVPWAMDEPESPLPPESHERQRIFGDAKLTLFYSGNFGLAHSFDDILNLAALLDLEDIKFAFSVVGNRKSELQAAVQKRALSIPFVPFARASELRTRLACADILIVTLREDWTGMVVPSKFFGALSAGRPILFAGSSESSLAKWIEEHRVGWTLSSRNIEEIRLQLIEYARSPSYQKRMREHCFSIYQQYFSMKAQIDRWDEILRSLLD